MTDEDVLWWSNVYYTLGKVKGVPSGPLFGEWQPPYEDESTLGNEAVTERTASNVRSIEAMRRGRGSSE